MKTVQSELHLCFLSTGCDVWRRWQPSNSDLWNGNECDTLNSFLCRANCPTLAPSLSPTVSSAEDIEIDGEEKENVVTQSILGSMFLIIVLALVAALLLLKRENKKVKELKKVLSGELEV